MRRARLAGLLLVALVGAPPAWGRAPQVPPPTPVPPSGSPSPFPTALDTPEPGRRPPRVSAAAVALADLDTGRLLFHRRGSVRRPIASVTKIMTLLLVLERTDPDDGVRVAADATREEGASLELERGERISVQDLEYALMLQSANDAAVALADEVGGSAARFVSLMNRRAGALRLRDTRFASPNGLDDSGYSSADDLAALTSEAFREPGFEDIVDTRFHTVPAPRGPARHLQNRNALLWLYPDAVGVKTGYTAAAGYCVVAAARREGLELVAVVLGAPGEAFSDAAALLDWGFENFEERTLLREGEPVDPLVVDGEDVPVGAGRAVGSIVRRSEEPEVQVLPLPRLHLPLADGVRVGRIEVRIGGRVVETVPLLTTSSVRAEESGGWLTGVWNALARAVAVDVPVSPRAARSFDLGP